MRDLTEAIRQTYLQGGPRKGWAKSMLYFGKVFLMTAVIARKSDEAKTLIQVSKSILREFNTNNFNEAQFHKLNIMISDFYSRTVDEVVLYSAYEHLAKAKLFNKGFVIHVIDQPRSLFKLQKEKPIHTKSLRKYKDDLKISTKTLGGEILLSQKYTKKIGVPSNVIGALKQINKERNTIHLKLFSIWSNDSILKIIDAVEWLKKQYR